MYNAGVIKRDDEDKIVIVSDPAEQLERKNRFERESKEKMKAEHAAAQETMKNLGKANQ